MLTLVEQDRNGEKIETSVLADTTKCLGDDFSVVVVVVAVVH